MKPGGLNWLALFASTGTLICCALPILLVTLGAGATVAALTSAFPILIALSEHKLWVFAGSGAMLALAAWMSWRRGRACPTQPALAQACHKAGLWNRRILTLAIAIWGIGLFAAFALYPLVRWWDGL
jgi:hypothetical protein